MVKTTDSFENYSRNNFQHQEITMKTGKLIGILVLVITLGIVFIQNIEPVRTHFLLLL